MSPNCSGLLYVGTLSMSSKLIFKAVGVLESWSDLISVSRVVGLALVD